MLVLTNGGALAIDSLANPRAGQAQAMPYAIVEAFNPAAYGGQAIADSLFGKANRWGKLPITMYPHEYIQQQPLTNYDMSIAPGRTYRYYQGKPLFSFGMGLSLTSFSLECNATAHQPPAPMPLSIDSGRNMSVECTVANTGSLLGDEVVQVYHQVGGALRTSISKLHPVPLRRLVQFERVTVAAGQAQRMVFSFDEQTFSLVTKNGSTLLYHGEHALIFSRGYGAEVTLSFILSGRP